MVRQKATQDPRPRVEAGTALAAEVLAYRMQMQKESGSPESQNAPATLLSAKRTTWKASGL